MVLTDLFGNTTARAMGRLISVFFVAVASASVLEAPSSGNTPEISLDEMLQYVGETKILDISGYTIRGADIPRILDTGVTAVILSNCLIVGGLNFAYAPQISGRENLESRLPSEWTAGQKEYWLGEFSVRSFRPIEAAISIADCEIVPDKDGLSIRGNACLFEETLALRRCHVRGGVNLRGATFLESTVFEGTRFDRSPDFSSTFFGGRLDCLDTQFDSGATFRACVARGPAYFTNCTLDGLVDFTESHFVGELNFRGSILRATLYFERVSFCATANFGKAEFFGPVTFYSATFASNADFSETIFRDKTTFYKATWMTQANFSDAVFKVLVDFRECPYIGELTIDRATFEQGGYLDKAQVHALFYDSSRRPIINEGRLSLRGLRCATFRLDHVSFKDPVDFYGARLGVPISLAEGQFGEATLCEIHSSTTPGDSDTDAVSLAFVSFDSGLVIDTGVFPKEVDLDEVRVENEDLNSLPALLAALESFHRKNDQIDRANTFLRQKGMTLQRDDRDRILSWWGGDGSAIPYSALCTFVFRLLYGASTGYGTSLGRIVMVIVTIDLVFGLLYFLAGEIRKVDRIQGKPYEPCFGLRLLRFPFQFRYDSQTSDTTYRAKFAHSTWIQEFLARLSDNLRFSTAVLLKVGFGDLHIEERSRRAGACRWLVRAEWALGYLVLIALTVTLSRTVPFVSDLLGNLF